MSELDGFNVTTKGDIYQHIKLKNSTYVKDANSKRC